ncbi:tRNA adenosine(34) deaminase TadA [Glaciecola petra]|uniref:tRNA-specific adenosine deaminase n=1 Tax=Glaciecola petra TaxID=3075602 RepID=A0ABU2ZM57_9ALTE|nr:tRNA adenosine(34) deaminase TadA [Aestuariibacter sp. P117]MDT0593715.1 tRNA adenosine(34) deaminase TadA [Aestuariibacter sp. P117]
MSDKNDHIYFMQAALKQAVLAQNMQEVPVGAVLVADGKIIGEGHNQPIVNSDPSLHAEMLAIRQAAKNVGNYRLPNTTLYVTLEPCCMCAGLLVHSRIEHLVFGAKDHKAGAVGSITNIAQHPKLNHQIKVTSGILEEECGQILSSFFKHRRLQKKRQ